MALPSWLTVKPLLYGLGVAAIVFVLHAGYSSIWQRGYDAKTAEVTLQATKDERTAAIAALAREAEVRAIEVANDAKMRNVEAEWAKRMTDAKATADRVTADLRAGNQRLQDHWAGCRATAALPGTAAAIAESSRADELRARDTGHLVEIGAKCDAIASALRNAYGVINDGR